MPGPPAPVLNAAALPTRLVSSGLSFLLFVQSWPPSNYWERQGPLPTSWVGRRNPQYLLFIKTFELSYCLKLLTFTLRGTQCLQFLSISGILWWDKLFTLASTHPVRQGLSSHLLSQFHLSVTFHLQKLCWHLSTALSLSLEFLFLNSLLYLFKVLEEKLFKWIFKCMFQSALFTTTKYLSFEISMFRSLFVTNRPKKPHRIFFLPWNSKTILCQRWKILVSLLQTLHRQTIISVLAIQSCLTLCDPMDYSPPDSSGHGISQARILEWVATSFSRASSQPRDRSWVSSIAVRFFTIWATREA